MKLTVEILLNSMTTWREQIADALKADDPERELRHLDASLAQAQDTLRHLMSRSLIELPKDDDD